MWFWLAFFLDALVAAIFLWFFVVGLADGTVSSFNLGLWLGILGALAAVLIGGWWLQHNGQPLWALRLVLVVAIPAALAALLLAIMLITKPNFR